MAMDLDTGILDVDGGRLVWEAAGSGRPVILLHGFSLDRRSWEPQMTSLAARHRVVRYDLRGFGASTLPLAPYRHIDDLRALTRALKLREPVLIGLSLGANIALAYSIEYAADVCALVLASPGLPGHPWRTQRPPEAAAAFAAEHGIEAGKRFWLEQPIFHSLRDHAQARRAVAQMVGDYSGWHWQHSDPQQPGPDIRAGLRTLDLPTLVISGDRDVEGYRQIAEEISLILPQAALMRLEKAGHMVNLEQPSVFTERVLQFIQEPYGQR